jgi:hypothetical protein
MVAAPVALLIALPFLIPYGTWRFTKGIYLSYRFRAKWRAEGRFILFVYSEGRIWHDYIEHDLLPRLQPNVVTLNWSKRAEWKKNPTLETKVFEHWRGQREYNPMAIIFMRFGRVKRIRFYRAFKGNKDLLRQQEEMLLRLHSKQRGR